MIVKRSIPQCIILSLFTGGIYYLYWMYCLTNETNEQSLNNQTVDGAHAVLYTIITFGIYGVYWAYKLGQKVDEIKMVNGSDASGLFAILAVFKANIINCALTQDVLNKLYDMGY